jgi:hypothetical protein
MQISPDSVPSRAGVTVKRSGSAPPLGPYLPGVRAAFLAVALISAGLAGLIALQGNSTSAPARGAEATATPTAILSPTAPPTTAPEAIASVWGPPVYSLSTQLGAGRILAASTITPDGQTLLGDLVTTGTGAASVTPALLILATHAVTELGMPSGTQASPPVCCQTDGRYAVAADPAGSNASCPYCAARLWIADLAEGSLRSLAPGSVEGVWLSQGRLLLQATDGSLSLVVLATGMSSAVSRGGSGLNVLGFAWPLAIARAASGSVHVLNLEASTDTILPQAEGLTSAAFDGTTLIAGKPDATGSGLEILSFARSDTSDPAMTVAGTFPDPTAKIFAANDSAIAFAGTRPQVWNRIAGVPVTLSAPPGASVTVALAGTFLLVASAITTDSFTAPQQISVYET